MKLGKRLDMLSRFRMYHPQIPPSPAACELKVGAMGPGAVSDLYWALARLRYQVGLNECLLLCRRDAFECMMCYQKDTGL